MESLQRTYDAMITCSHYWICLTVNWDYSSKYDMIICSYAMWHDQYLERCDDISLCSARFIEFEWNKEEKKLMQHFHYFHVELTFIVCSSRNYHVCILFSLKREYLKIVFQFANDKGHETNTLHSRVAQYLQAYKNLRKQAWRNSYKH